MPGQTAKISSNQQYREVLHRGRSVADSLAVLYVLMHDDQAGPARFGVSVPRRFGSAVARNRVRRLFWEAYRLQVGMVRGGCDLVLIPRTGARRKRFPLVAASLRQLLMRQGLLAQGGEQ